MSRSVLVRAGRAHFAQDISVENHALRADEPHEAGGGDLGPTPYELLLSALGACTGITLRMYADKKQWPLEGVKIKLSQASAHAQDCSACDVVTPALHPIELEISFLGDLSEDQRQRLLRVASQCPVHRALDAQFEIRTRLVDLADKGAEPA
jgi:putative redox protein